jgi:DNA-binding CsgD family transcriptional regulator/tetratricopeptide (TPR) repeat protein
MLVERGDHVAALQRAHRSAGPGAGRLVLVSGEAGAGKSSVVEAFSDSLGAGAEVTWCRCDALPVPRPLGAFSELPGLAVDDGGDGAYRTFEHLQGVLAHGGVLVLEDLHWADEATLSVLRLLGRRLATVAGLVVATYRDDQLDRSHPLWIALGDIASPAGVLRLPVGRLTRPAIATLAAGHSIDADELFRLTSGNAFYVSEVLASEAVAVPATVREAVLARVARLDPQAVTVLEVVSLLTRAASPRLIERVCPDAHAAVRACFDAGLLVAAPGGVAFRHELARLVVADEVEPTRRRALHASLLAALAVEPTPDLARLASHAEDADDADAVQRLAPAAAREAARLGAHREAAAQYARALRFGHALAPAERAALLEARAEALFNTDEQVASIADLQEAIGCHRATGAVIRESAVLCRIVSHLLCRGGNDDARTAAEQALALALATDDVEAIARAERAVACVDFNDDAVDQAIARIESAHARVAASPGSPVAVDVTISLAGMRADRDGPAAFPLMEAALREATARGDADRALRIHNNLAVVAMQHHVADVAEREIAAGLALCEQADVDLWRLSMLGVRATLELERCEWDAAAATGAYLADSGLDSPDSRYGGLIALALARARRGDPGADEALDAADATAGSITQLAWAGPLARARAEIAWLHGRPELVERATGDPYALACSSWAPWEAGVLACWRRRAGLPVAPARITAEPCALELAGRHRDAAEAWDALGCRYEAALALASSGDPEAVREAHERLRAIGAQGAATVVARQARTLGVRGLTSGPRQRTRENPANLTARELDVLALLGEGLTNAAIAERLVVSPRTVDHHVSAVLRKLDVPTRARAGVEAARLGIGVPAR